MSKEERRKKHVGDIYSNSLKCRLCEQVIRSTNRHDYVTCKCGECSIDGGSWYVRICGKQENIELLTEMYDNK
jgi:hypothetical protein